VHEGYLYALQLRICGDTTLCDQPSSYVWQPVSYSPTFPPL